jgi:hypothetical protein
VAKDRLGFSRHKVIRPGHKAGVERAQLKLILIAWHSRRPVDDGAFALQP